MIRIIRALAFAVALSAGHAQAATYVLIDHVTAAVSAPPRADRIVAGTTGGPASTVTYQVIVGDSASSCTVQPVGSNDQGAHWTNQGSAITVAAGGLTGSAAITATWDLWGATVTSVTGTCTVLASG